jgi:hypothetical protein
MTILSDAIRRARSKLDEPAYPTLPNSTPGNPAPRFYTDTELTDWVNSGLLDISRRAEDLITYYTNISIPAYGQNATQPPPTYSLPNDIIRVNRVEFQVTGDTSQIYPLEAATQTYLDQIWNVNQLSTMAYPSYWCTRGYPGGSGNNTFLIQLFPNSGQAGQLNLFYYRLPTHINDPVADPSQYNVSLDILAGWDDMVIDWVYKEGLLKRHDPQWEVANGIYESKMTSLIDQSRRFNDQPQYFGYDGMVAPWGAGDGWGGL